jgi:hypothetical protein
LLPRCMVMLMSARVLRLGPKAVDSAAGEGETDSSD